MSEANKTISSTQTKIVSLLSGFIVGYTISWILKFKSKRYQAIRYLTSKSTDLKMVFVVPVNTDAFKSRKIISYSVNAAISGYKVASTTSPDILNTWLLIGQPKIVLRLKTKHENPLDVLSKKAESLGISYALIPPNNRNAVVLALGPAQSSIIDSVTGHLRLL